MLACGLVVIFKTYPVTLPPPSYDSLNELDGTLVNISTNFGRRGGVRVKVKDNAGNIIRFPSGSDRLNYSKSVARKIKEKCIGKPVLVKWTEEKVGFITIYRHAWEIRVCSEGLDLDYKKTKNTRLKTRSFNFFVLFVGFLLVIPFFVYSFLSYKNSKYSKKE